MRFALRLTLALAIGVLGAAAGVGVGVLWAAPGDGMVGGAKVALGMAAGGAVGLVAGVLAAWRSPPKARGRLAAAAIPLAGVALAAAAWSAWQAREARRDPDAAHAGLPVFELRLTRARDDDPVLAPAVLVDAEDRRWTLRLPDGRTCEGRLRAEARARLGEAARAALPPPRGACRDAPPAAGAPRLEWRLAGPPEVSGGLRLDAACTTAHPPLEGLARLLAMAASLADGGASCD